VLALEHASQITAPLRGSAGLISTPPPANPKKRGEILNRLSHRFDFRDKLAARIERQASGPLADLRRARGAGDRVFIIGGGQDVDGSERPLRDAIDLALASLGGIFAPCIPRRLALLIQEFPPGEIFLLCRD
jgi:hypothetical protein